MAVAIVSSWIAPVVLGGIITIVFLLWTWKHNRDILFPKQDLEHSKLPLPPGSMGMPFVGKTREAGKIGWEKFAKKGFDKYNTDIFKTFLYGRPIAIVKGSANFKHVLMNENKLVNMWWPEPVIKMFGSESIIFTADGQHAKLRQIIGKLFTPKAMEKYIPKMEVAVDKYIKKWEKAAKSGEEVLIYPDFSSITFEVIMSTLLAQDDAASPSMIEAFNRVNQAIVSDPIDFPWTKFGKGRRAADHIMNVLEKTILEFQNKKIDNPTTALEIIMAATDEDGEKLSLESLKCQLFVLLFAGFATTSGTLADCCYHFAKNPEVLKKIREEQEEVRPDANAPWTSQQLKKMSYLQMAMWECMRVRPSVTAQFRAARETFEIGGFQVPKGWLVLLSLGNNIQTCPSFTEPQSFKPERFSSGVDERKLDPFGFRPFGAGKRSCPGEPLGWSEVQMVMAEMSRKLSWRLKNKSTCWDTGHVLFPTDGLPIYFSEN